MKKPTEYTLTRPIFVAAGLAIIGGLSLGYAVPGIAADTATKPKAEEHVMIHVVKHGPGDGMGKEPSIAAITSDCGGQAKRIDTETVTKDESGKTEKARIVLCAMGGKDDAELLSRLQKAREKIAGEKVLSDDARTKTLAAIDAEIEKLKSGPGFSRQ